MSKKLEQKLLAIALILISIITIPLVGNDITFAIIMVPFGLYLLFTRKIWIY